MAGVLRDGGLFCWEMREVGAGLFRGFLSPLACPDLIKREPTALWNVPGEGGRLLPRGGLWVLEGTRGVTLGDAGQAPGGRRGKLGAEVTVARGACCGRQPLAVGQRGRRAGEGIPPRAAVAIRRRGLHRPDCQASAGGGREEGVEVRGEEGWHRSAAVSVQ